MFGILAKFFRFSGRENGNKFKLSIVIGLIEALASAMKIPAIMYILIGLMSGKPIGKYIGGSIAIMVIAIVVDVKEMSLADFNRKMAYVAQDNDLFNETVRENIRQGNPEATDEQIIEVTKKSGCYEFIMQLENGFDTVVGGAGGHLSGGERQRISIARAMLKDAPIVILDEATAYTDPESEAILQNSIAKLVAGKTLIVIAHRLSTVKDSDQIFVVNDGNVTAHGTHEELLMSCPLYKEMWDAHISVKDTVKEGE